MSKTGEDGSEETIVIDEKPAEEKPEPITVADLAKQGFVPEEIDMAKRHGMVSDDDGDDDKGDGGEEKKSDPKKVDGKDNGGGNDGQKKEEGKKRDVLNGQSVDERFRVISDGKRAEEIIREIDDKGNLSEEQEKVLIASLSNNGSNLYWSQKYERRQKQKAQADLADAKKALEEKEKRIKELEEQAKNNRTTESDDEDPLNLDGGKKKEGDGEDPKKKFLTQEDLDKREKEKNTQAAEEQKKQEERAAAVKEALDEQEKEAQSRYKDFDEGLAKATEIIKAASEGRLEEYFKDPREQSRIVREVKLILHGFATADAFEQGEYNPADMLYDLGKKHPNFGKPQPKADANGKKNGEPGRDGSPEEARRALQNANRRGSSASLGGGSRREIALDELTPEQAEHLSDEQWRKLPKATREKLLGKS